MILDLNMLCFHEYICVLDPICDLYALVIVLNLRPQGDNGWDIDGDDFNLRSSCIHHVLMLCSGTLLKGAP